MCQVRQFAAAWWRNQWQVMQTLRLRLERSDPEVVELFDQLVLRGHLKPFVPECWEVIRWGEAEWITRGWTENRSELHVLTPFGGALAPSIGLELAPKLAGGCQQCRLSCSLAETDCPAPITSASMD